MSMDRNSEERRMDGLTDEEQRTRAVESVEGQAEGAYRRRRRSERYQYEREEASGDEQLTDEPARQPEVYQGRNAARRTVQTSYASQQAHPGQSVPRPNALNRAAQGQPAVGQGGRRGQAVRRPVNAPGFSQRPPVNSRPEPEGMARVRRPIPMGEEELVPARGREAERQQDKGALVTVVVIILVLALAVLGFMLIPQDDSPLGRFKQTVTRQLAGLLGQETAPAAEALDFSAAPVQGVAPIDVAFTLTASKSVTAVRVVDEIGVPLTSASSYAMENTDANIWMMSLSVDSGYEGLVQAQVMDQEGQWLDTGKTVMLEIASLQATEAPTQEPTAEPTLAPTEAPTPEAAPETTDSVLPVMAAVPTEEPTAVPTEVPTQEPTAVPTMTPTEAPTAVPTQEPVETEVPTQAPTSTPTLAPTPVPTAVPVGTPEPTAMPELTVEAGAEANPKLIADTVIYNGTKKVEGYNRALEDVLRMPAGSQYTTLPYGVLTFRGDAFRQNAASGTVNGVNGMELIWSAEASSVKGASDTYYGIGWYGQPAIVKWSKEIRENSNISEEKRNVSALKEVIVAGLDGRIYFLDLEDGQPTRDPINVGYPMKGSPSIHSLCYPMMTVGQYARKMASGTGKIGLRFYNLMNQKQVYMIDGLDGDAERPYYSVGAFDSSALVDRNTDTMVTIGTNGMLYVTKLNSKLQSGEFDLTMDPESVVMKSRTKNQKNSYTAVESSLAMYGSYVYYADMDGILRCVDTSTMTTLWAVDTGDAVQAAIALDMTQDGQLWLYTGNTLQNRKKGDAVIRRFNALTGEESWALEVGVTTTKNRISGVMASPVIGQNSLENLVYFTVTGLSKAGTENLLGEADKAAAAVLLAMDKSTGEIVWKQELDSYSYSSPVAVYSDYGEGWIIQATGSGTVTLYNGLTGQMVSSLEVEGTIEASPAVYRDTLVIGTTGKNTAYIYGIKLTGAE